SKQETHSRTTHDILYYITPKNLLHLHRLYQNTNHFPVSFSEQPIEYLNTCQILFLFFVPHQNEYCHTQNSPGDYRREWFYLWTSPAGRAGKTGSAGALHNQSERPAYCPAGAGAGGGSGERHHAGM